MMQYIDCMWGRFKIKKFYVKQVTSPEWWDKHHVATSEEVVEAARYRSQLFYPVMMRYLEKGKRYVDAGCGLGGWVAFLRGEGYDMIGVESSAQAVELVQRTKPKVPIQQGDIRQLPFSDDSFDGYVALGSWEYVEDATAEVAREAARVIKTGGVLFLEVPYANPVRLFLYMPLKALQVWWGKKVLGHTPTFAFYFFSRGYIRRVLTAQGFTVVEERPHDVPEQQSHYGLWIDWPFLRGKKQYELNGLGRVVKAVMNTISPWIIATGMFVVARKK